MVKENDSGDSRDAWLATGENLVWLFGFRPGIMKAMEQQKTGLTETFRRLLVPRALIILELRWIVLMFLKKQKFILGPFLAISISAAVRRILLIEAQTSFIGTVEIKKNTS